MIRSSQSSGDANGSVQRLAVTVEILAYVVYLFSQTDMCSEKQRYYLDWAATVMIVNTIRSCASELGRVPVTNPQ
jgi:hypothetical protein